MLHVPVVAGSQAPLGHGWIVAEWTRVALHLVAAIPSSRVLASGDTVHCHDLVSADTPISPEERSSAGRTSAPEEGDRVTHTHDDVGGDVARIVDRLGHAWDELRDSAVFVTGGTGFIGRWMLESLVHANEALQLRCRVVVLTRDPEAFASTATRLAAQPIVRLLTGDAGTFRFPAGDFSHVLHLAKEPAGDLGISAPGTRRVLEFALSRGARKLLFTSSGAVYGSQPAASARTKEELAASISPDDLTTLYARAKYAGEALCREACARSALETKIARCFALVGPCMEFEGPYAVGNFIRDAEHAERIDVIGDGTAVRSFLYAQDLAVWLWTILFRGEPGLAYNVGSEEAISIANLARLVARVAGGDKPVRIHGTPQSAGPAMDRYVPDTGLATSTLGLTVDLELEEAVRRTLAWYRLRSL
jgi:nucleoside-diphosphate-sugar epimerase